MKNKLLAWIKLAFMPPILSAIILGILLAIANWGNQSDINFLILLLLMLLVYSLPYFMLYAFMMILLDARKNINGLKKSIICGLIIGFASIFVSEGIWGDGHAEMGFVYLAAAAGGVAGAMTTLFFPKPD